MSDRSPSANHPGILSSGIIEKREISSKPASLIPLEYHLLFDNMVIMRLPHFYLAKIFDEDMIVSTWVQAMEIFNRS